MAIFNSSTGSAIPTDTGFTTDDTLTMTGSVLSVTTPTKGATKAEFDAMTEQQKKGLVIVTDEEDGGGSSGDGSSGGEVYSTEEVRIGTWIDGKPLYRIVMTIPKTQTANETKIALPVSDIENIYGIRGCVVEKDIDGNGTNQMYAFPAYLADDYVSCAVDRTNGITMKRSGSIFVGMSVILILEYTKTTDEGSAT